MYVSHGQNRGNKRYLLFAAILVFAFGCILVFYKPNHAASQSLLEQNLSDFDLFTSWMLAHNKHYSNPTEQDHRFQVFQQNLAKIRAHNSNPFKTFTMGLNKFSALSSSEFSAQVNGFIDHEKPTNFTILNTGDLPDAVNWTAEGAVTLVKDQLECGSCWSFSATGALEGLYEITNKSLVSFSEQQIMDCSWMYLNLGCDGGRMTNAFKYTAHKGIEPDSDYPYTAKSSFHCKYDETNVVFKNSGFESVVPQNISQLKTAVARQPVSVAVEADQESWQHYAEGVITSECGNELDHGVLIVGYGKNEDGIEYWNVKNSWGEDWGMQGYVLIEMTDSDLCGIMSMPSYPTS